MDRNMFNDADTSDPMTRWDLNGATAVVDMLYQLDGGKNALQLKRNEDRLLEIDRYYISKYKAQTNILKTFIFFCCLALIGAIIYNKQLMTLLTYTCYIAFIFIVMLLIIGRDIFNLFMRDNQNFDEFDYSIYYRPTSIGSNMYKGRNTAELSNLPSCPS